MGINKLVVVGLIASGNVFSCDEKTALSMRNMYANLMTVCTGPDVSSKADSTRKEKFAKFVECRATVLDILVIEPMRKDIEARVDLDQKGKQAQLKCVLNQSNVESQFFARALRTDLSSITATSTDVEIEKLVRGNWLTRLTAKF